jgi:hypothetical protein
MSADTLNRGWYPTSTDSAIPPRDVQAAGISREQLLANERTRDPCLLLTPDCQNALSAVNLRDPTLTEFGD